MRAWIGKLATLVLSGFFMAGLSAVDPAFAQQKKGAEAKRQACIAEARAGDARARDAAFKACMARK